MPTIALEMERLRNPYSGLGQYCLQLGRAFADLSAGALAKEDRSLPVSAKTVAGKKGLEFACLVPEERMGEFGKEMIYKAVKPWHKLLGASFGTEISVWHCMHQDSEYMPRNRKTPLAITIHDLNFLDRPDYSEAKKSRRMASMQQKIKRAKGLVYISEYVRQWVHEHLSVPEGMVEQVIYNGGSFEAQIAPSDRQPSTVHGQPSTVNRPPSTVNRQPYLFSIGIHPKKNYHVLMPILKAFPSFKWIIAGPDSRGYRSKIEQEAARLGVSDRLEFCGPVGDVEKRDYYENCTALLFPSLSEGFGLPVVEAMSLGKPVFLSNRTSLPEIGGKEAYYFHDFEPETLTKAFSHGMEDFRNDPEKPARMQSWAAQFNWKKAADQYLDFYQEILNPMS